MRCFRLFLLFSISLSMTGLWGCGAGTGAIRMPSGPPVATMTHGPIKFNPLLRPYPVHVTNGGGGSMVIESITITGPDASAFHQVPVNRGLGNCFAGITVTPLGICYVGVQPIEGTVGPKQAELVFKTSDPKNPTISIPLMFAAK